MLLPTHTERADLDAVLAAAHLTAQSAPRMVCEHVPANTYKNATYYSANLIWLPVERLGVGIEYLYGTRENKDGQGGTGQRIQAGIQYRF